MRVELTDPSHYPDLRDYFLRLGAEVARTDETAIDVDFADGILDDDESIEMYLKTWARHRQVDARVTAVSRLRAAHHGAGSIVPAV